MGIKYEVSKWIKNRLGEYQYQLVYGGNSFFRFVGAVISAIKHGDHIKIRYWKNS